MRKSICALLILTFGASLFAAGALADPGCGVKCCCLSTPSGSDHMAGEQMPASAGCCHGGSAVPCDLESESAFEIPAATLVAAGNWRSPAAGAVGLANASPVDPNRQKIHYFRQSILVPSQSPLLYLQKRAFLI